ncbi:MAG: tRNA dihydrouridine(20/20a) synthase DusA [Pseudomonadota bacterium]
MTAQPANAVKGQIFSPRRYSVAPMMDWTDRHCRYLHRRLSRRTRLYTEMVTAPAVLFGPKERLLAFDPAEHPVALQLGGSAPDELAEAVKIAASYGFDEINLNVGCPSDRVQSGAFGACLMKTPELVAECCAAMIAASREVGGPEITVKSRIGVDEQEPRKILPLFLAAVAEAGVRSFTIHARKAWLEGLSPKENRDIPLLDYPLVYEMKAARPDLEIILNGGVGSIAEAQAHLRMGVDGVMVGRAAYHEPVGLLASADREIFGEERADKDPFEAIEDILPYIERQLAQGVRLNQITRHMLGMFAGRPGARRWRRALSEHAHRPSAGPELIREAMGHLSQTAA